MEIFINGEKKEISGSMSLTELIAYLDLDARTMAVGRNGMVVPKNKLENVKIESGDQIDLVRFVAGG